MEKKTHSDPQEGATCPDALANLLNLSRKGSLGNIFGVNLQRNAFRSKEIKFWRIEWFLVFLSYFDTDFIALEVYPCWAALMIRAGVSGH